VKARAVAVLRALSPRLTLRGLVLPLSLLLLWEFASRQSVAYAYAFVPLAEIWRSLLELLDSGELLFNLFATLRTVLFGLCIGGGLGLALGGLMGASAMIDRIVGPLFHTVRQVPLLGWIPLIGLWFGSGDLSKVLIVSLAAFYPMVLNTHEGIRSIEHRYLEVARVLKFGRWQAFRRVMLPGALPSIMTGSMHALAFAWIATVGSELLFVAGPGLGGLMQTALTASRMDIVVLCVASIGITGLLMNHLFLRFGNHLLRWRSLR
jgi:sulfonate transport system permease protein